MQRLMLQAYGMSIYLLIIDNKLLNVLQQQGLPNIHAVKIKPTHMRGLLTCKIKANLD